MTYINVCQVCRVCQVFSTSIYHLFKKTFFFIKRTLTQNYLTHLTHTPQSRMYAEFFTKSSWHTSRHTPDTQPLVPDTHLHLLYIYTVSMSTNREPRSMFHDFIPQSAILRFSAPPKRLKEALNIIFKPTHTPLSKTNPRWEPSFFLKSVDRRLWKTRYCLYFT